MKQDTVPPGRYKPGHTVQSWRSETIVEVEDYNAYERDSTQIQQR